MAGIGTNPCMVPIGAMGLMVLLPLFCADASSAEMEEVRLHPGLVHEQIIRIKDEPKSRSGQGKGHQRSV